ncbi:endolytic transglycosylase MltG [Alphaproteobacteria bacterium]|nr:endolytic transglycosylase MltG [Alphaproteobacteria bacterium]
MEEQILRFYLKVFSFLLIFVLYFFYLFLVREINLKNDYFVIKKNENYINIINNNIIDNNINLFIYKQSLRAFLLINNEIHFGKFKLKKNPTYYQILKSIVLPSNVFNKITIVEGWSKSDLNTILKKNFDNFHELKYEKIIADTYMFANEASFFQFKKLLDKKYLLIKNKFKKHPLLEKYSFYEILTIASLLEKEGIDYEDKRKIYSVIINRLNLNMKLQIDATVIFSLTEGKIDLQRKLNYADLKIENPYNTYKNYGLPPGPISYVGYKTIELIFENYKTEYLFYFYNSQENKHIFSLNYKDHLKRLNEYRSKK